MITRELNTEYVFSLSYGKDSITCLEAIKQLNYPAGYYYLNAI